MAKTSTLSQIAQSRTALDQEFLSRQSLAWFQKNIQELKSPIQLAKEISKEVGISISNTYNYMTRVRKLQGDKNPTRKYKARKKLTPVNKAEKPKANPEAQVPPTIQAVYDEMGRLRNLLLDKDAIIRYLENKIALVFSAK